MFKSSVQYYCEGMFTLADLCWSADAGGRFDSCPAHQPSLALRARLGGQAKSITTPEEYYGGVTYALREQEHRQTVQECNALYRFGGPSGLGSHVDSMVNAVSSKELGPAVGIDRAI